ncbi:MAG: hypothetical protein VYE77_06775 [Planctomycetota bacterium]|nr:hypothetical protein [Planctomycetota bacterium]
MKHSTAWLLAIGACLGAAVWAIWHGVTGWPTLATHVRDDAFYEFAWATNLVRTGEPTVSDGIATSGVQYLWCLLLAWFAGGHPQVVETIAIVAGFACHVLGALTWIWFTRSPKLGVCLALLWLGNPLLLRECQNGQETALACLLGALLWHARRSRELWFALLVLLAVLARTDLWLVAALLSVVRHGRRWWLGLPTPALALAVHMAANVAVAGALTQDSALPLPWLVHANFELAAWRHGIDWVVQQWWYTRPALLGGPFALAGAVGWALAVYLGLRPVLKGLWSWAVLVAVGVAWGVGMEDLSVPLLAGLLLAWRPARGRRPVPWLLLALTVGLAAIVWLHWAVRWYPRDYYLAPLVVVAIAALQRVGRLPVWLIAAALVQCWNVTTFRTEPLRHQLAMDMAGRYLAELLPAGERVGCFNSGLVTFRQLEAVGVSEPLRVVNLDGVVDARSFAALRDRRLGQWLNAEQVHYLVDHPAQFSLDPAVPHACGHWFGVDPPRLRELARFVVPGVDAERQGTSDFRLYVRGDHSVPALPGAPRQLGVSDAGVVVLWPADAGAVLEVEAADGLREELLRAEVDGLVVVLVPKDRLGTGRLFLRGQSNALLELVSSGR